MTRENFNENNLVKKIIMEIDINEALLKDVLINLGNGKYSKKETIESLAWGEKNTDIYWPLVSELQPNYYNQWDKICPVKSFTIIKDFDLNL